MGRTADTQDLVRPDYVEETRKIGERFTLWHDLVEAAHTADAFRMRRLWALAGRHVELEALQNLREKVKGKMK